MGWGIIKFLEQVIFDRAQSLDPMLSDVPEDCFCLHSNLEYSKKIFLNFAFCLIRTRTSLKFLRTANVVFPAFYIKCHRGRSGDGEAIKSFGKLTKLSPRSAGL